MYDLHVDRSVSREVLAEVFGIPADAVRIVAELTGDEDLRGIALLCTLRVSAGDFPNHLAIYPRQASDLTEAALATAINLELGSRCLISDDRVNPFTWTLIDADGIATAVHVDPEALDRNELTVSLVAPRLRSG